MFAPSQTWRTYVTSLINLRDEFRGSGALYIIEEGWEDPANDDPQWRKMMCSYMGQPESFWSAEQESDEEEEREKKGTIWRECTGCDYKYLRDALLEHQKTCNPYKVRMARLERILARSRSPEEEGVSSDDDELPTLEDGFRDRSTDPPNTGSTKIAGPVRRDPTRSEGKLPPARATFPEPRHRTAQSTNNQSRSGTQPPVSRKGKGKGVVRDEPINLEDSDEEQRALPSLESPAGRVHISISPTISPAITVNNHHISSSSSFVHNTGRKVLVPNAMTADELLQCLSVHEGFGREWLSEQRTRLVRLQSRRSPPSTVHPPHRASPEGTEGISPRETSPEGSLLSAASPTGLLQQGGPLYDSAGGRSGTSKPRGLQNADFEESELSSMFDWDAYDGSTFDPSIPPGRPLHYSHEMEDGSSMNPVPAGTSVQCHAILQHAHSNLNSLFNLRSARYIVF
jgi:hypothetical protein